MHYKEIARLYINILDFTRLKGTVQAEHLRQSVKKEFNLALTMVLEDDHHPSPIILSISMQVNESQLHNSPHRMIPAVENTLSIKVSPALNLRDSGSRMLCSKKSVPLTCVDLIAEIEGLYTSQRT